MNLQHLRQSFPQQGKNVAITGKIPMDYFVANEKQVRKVIKENNLRLYYRGKRIKGAQSTKRVHANSVVLYYNATNQVKSIPSKKENTVKGPSILVTIICLLLSGLTLGVIVENSNKAPVFNSLLDTAVSYLK